MLIFLELIPDIHSYLHQVLAGIEVHICLEFIPLSSFLWAHYKDIFPGGVVFTEAAHHSVPVLILFKQDCVVVEKCCGKRGINPNV